MNGLLNASLSQILAMALPPVAFAEAEGKLTIGIGRNLDFCGISQKEAYTMLERDIQDCEQWLIEEKFSYYWQGLVGHTALRIRKFGMLQSYKKAKARYYKLVFILNDYISDICLALTAQDKIYLLNVALEVIDNLIALDIKSNSLDDTWKYIKAFVPWIKDEQIGYDTKNELGRYIRNTYSLSAFSLEVQDKDYFIYIIGNYIIKVI
jgi:hypothetical protein